jgi:endonuclease G
MSVRNLDTQIDTLKRQLSSGEVLLAIDGILSLVAGNRSLYNDALLQRAHYVRVERDERRGVLGTEQATVEKNRIIRGLLDLLDELPSRLTRADLPVASPQPSGEIQPFAPVKPEKIIGINNLKQISWLARGLDCARSVCRVLTPGGLGTGFLIAPDIIMTNHHVIPCKEIARHPETWVEFNYQIAFDGGFERACRYKLGHQVFCTDHELDFTLVKVMVGPQDPPLKQWGYLVLNPNADPVPGELVSIIQHPNGGLKQIVVSNNQVVGVRAPYLWYATDTMGGSSGAPVFNDQWHVIALHHAGGDNGYNEGILISHIKQRAEAQGCWPEVQSKQ